MATAIVEKEQILMTTGSRSLGKAVGPRGCLLQSLAYVTAGSLIYYGDEAMLFFWDMLKINWGEPPKNPAAVDQLQQGYQYIWNINIKKFTVVNDIGDIVAMRTIKTLYDLMISVEIAGSHQFKIIVDQDLLNASGCVIGYRAIGNRDLSAQPDTLLMDRGAKMIHIDKPDKLHLRFMKGMYSVTGERLRVIDKGHFVKEPQEGGELFIDPEILREDRWKVTFMWNNDYREIRQITINFTALIYIGAILYAKVRDLSADGHFPTNFQERLLEFPADRIEKIMDGTGKDSTILMIYIVAMGELLSCKPVFEPWMLWPVWRWLGRTRQPMSERIFDLSPWWG